MPVLALHLSWGPAHPKGPTSDKYGFNLKASKGGMKVGRIKDPL